MKKVIFFVLASLLMLPLGSQAQDFDFVYRVKKAEIIDGDREGVFVKYLTCVRGEGGAVTLTGYTTAWDDPQLCRFKEKADAARCYTEVEHFVRTGNDGAIRAYVDTQYYNRSGRRVFEISLLGIPPLS